MTCAIHAHARTARQLHISQINGHGGKHCLRCGRVFRDPDFVEQRQVKKPIGPRPGDPYGWVHVACAPTAPRVTQKKEKERPKPLWSLLEDPA